MRARGQALLTLIVCAVVLAGGIVAGRLGARPRQQAASGEAVSGAWLCPHGGGEDWTGQLFLANPGALPSTARITSLGSGRAEPATMVQVPPGEEVAFETSATERSSSTYVEWFGGWIAAGWVIRGAAGEVGVGAEPCAPAAGRRWYASDGATRRGEGSYLVVMNPFEADAVVDVALFTADRAPIRDSDWTDLTLGARRSLALPLNAKAKGEGAVGVQVDVSSGRVAVSTLGIGAPDGIRSVLGTTETSTTSILPVGGGAGQSELAVFVPGEQGVTFGATLLSRNPPQPAGGLTTSTQDPASAKTYPVVTEGPASIALLIRDGGPGVASQRASGVGDDSAATGGVVRPATAWVVLPTVAGEPALPGLVLVNPGQDEATVTVRLLARGGEPGQELTVTVPPASVRAAAATFLGEATDAAALVTTDGGPIVALGASTSLGTHGLAGYGLSVGVPVPPDVLSGSEA